MSSVCDLAYADIMRPKEVKGKRKGGKASSVRSKVSEVKKRARMRNESGREEILDLVSATPSAAATPRQKRTLAKAVSGRLKKVKSAVGIGNKHARLQETPSAKNKDSPAKVRERRAA